MVNMTFIGQSTLDIRKKLQSLHGALGMNPSQLMDITFKIYNGQGSKEDKASHGVLRHRVVKPEEEAGP